VWGSGDRGPRRCGCHTKQLGWVLPRTSHDDGASPPRRPESSNQGLRQPQPGSLRLLAVTAGLVHNQHISVPGRDFAGLLPLTGINHPVRRTRPAGDARVPVAYGAPVDAGLGTEGSLGPGAPKRGGRRVAIACRRRGRRSETRATDSPIRAVISSTMRRATVPASACSRRVSGPTATRCSRASVTSGGSTSRATSTGGRAHAQGCRPC
jgi:hypothetical protein